MLKVVLVLPGVVLVAVLRVVVEEAKGGEAIGGPLFFLLGVTAAGIFSWHRVDERVVVFDVLAVCCVWGCL